MWAKTKSEPAKHTHSGQTTFFAVIKKNFRKWNAENASRRGKQTHRGDVHSICLCAVSVYLVYVWYKAAMMMAMRSSPSRLVVLQED